MGEPESKSPPPDTPGLDGREPPQQQRSRRSRLGVACFKAAVVVVLVVGFGYAVNSAVVQWRLAASDVDRQLVQLDAKIAEASAAGQPTEPLRARASMIADGRPSLSRIRWRWMLVAGVCHAIALLPPAMVLKNALHALGLRISTGRVVAAQVLGHAGKYVPGKALVVVLRVAVIIGETPPVGDSALPVGDSALPEGDSVPRPSGFTASGIAVTCVFWETFLMMGVGAAVSACVIVTLPVPTWIAVTAVGIAVGATAATHPAVVRIVIRLVLGHRIASFAGGDLRLFVTTLGWSLLAWLLIGGSFTAVILAIPAVGQVSADSVAGGFWSNYPVGTAAIAFGMVAGFLSLLPGGAGMRELVMTAILVPFFGPVHALLTAIAARLLSILVESTLAAAAWVWHARSRNTTTPSGANS